MHAILLRDRVLRDELLLIETRSNNVAELVDLMTVKLQVVSGRRLGYVHRPKTQDLID